MPDFTIHKYTQLLNALIEKSYHFQTFEQFLTNPSSRSIVLRHDVDKGLKIHSQQQKLNMSSH